MTTSILVPGRPVSIPTGQGIMIAASTSQGTGVNLRLGDLGGRDARQVGRVLGPGQLFLLPPTPHTSTVVSASPAGGGPFPPGVRLELECVVGNPATGNQVRLRTPAESVGGFERVDVVLIEASGTVVTVGLATRQDINAALAPLAQAALEATRRVLGRGVARPIPGSTAGLQVVIDQSVSMLDRAADIVAATDVLAGVLVGVGHAGPVRLVVAGGDAVHRTAPAEALHEVVKSLLPAPISVVGFDGARLAAPAAGLTVLVTDEAAPFRAIAAHRVIEVGGMDTGPGVVGFTSGGEALREPALLDSLVGAYLTGLLGGGAA